MVFLLLVKTFNAASIQSGDCIRILSSSTSFSFAECNKSKDSPVLTNFLIDWKEATYELSITSSRTFWNKKGKDCLFGCSRAQHFDKIAIHWNVELY